MKHLIVFIVLIWIFSSCQVQKDWRTSPIYFWNSETQKLSNSPVTESLNPRIPKEAKKIQRIWINSESKEFDVELLPNLKEINFYCVLPNWDIKNLSVESFNFTASEECDDFLGNQKLKECMQIQSIVPQLKSIALGGERVGLFQLPKNILQSENIIDLYIERTSYVPLQFLFKVNVNQFNVQGPLYPERELIAYMRKGRFPRFLYELNEYNADQSTLAKKLYYYNDEIPPPIPEVKENDNFECNYKDGTPLVRGQFIDRAPHNVWTFYYLDGSIAETRHYHKGLETGEWKFFNVDGELIRSIRYKKGEPTFIITNNIQRDIRKTSIDPNVSNEQNIEEYYSNHHFETNGDGEVLKFEKSTRTTDKNGNVIRESKDTKVFENQQIKSRTVYYIENGKRTSWIEYQYDYTKNEFTKMFKEENGTIISQIVCAISDQSEQNCKTIR